MKEKTSCPQCGFTFRLQSNPYPTVDVVIAHPGKGIVLIERRFEPLGWALPGGFVELGESVEEAARREGFEETGLKLRLAELLGVYSKADRDPRMHTISTVFVALTDTPELIRGGDDAAQARFYPLSALPQTAFDHAAIIDDFRRRLAQKYGVLP
ncbi:MAG: NUDIX hydrolase [Desulfovibrio sp.]|nr:NUDIX hydrolase [Desulfovibrio sp.]